MNTDREILKWFEVRDLRIMKAKEKSLEFKKNITKKRRRK